MRLRRSIRSLAARPRDAVTTAFTYDAWGRTGRKEEGGEGTAYTYRYGGRLVGVEKGDSDDVYYAYNGLGQRIRRSWMDDYSTDYYWNGWSVVNEYFDDDDAEQYGWAKTYLGGLGERFYVGGAYSYYFADHLGSTEAVYNESTNRDAGIEHTPYGAIAFAEGTANSYTRRYTGHDWDPLTGDYFAPYRFYSPGSHRWLTRDPLGMVDGPNVYAYVGGNGCGLLRSTRSYSL